MRRPGSVPGVEKSLSGYTSVLPDAKCGVPLGCQGLKNPCLDITSVLPDAKCSVPLWCQGLKNPCLDITSVLPDAKCSVPRLEDACFVLPGIFSARTRMIDLIGNHTH